MVAICILNWNNWLETIKCLESSFAQTNPAEAIVVVENGSQNESLHEIQNWLESNAPRAGYSLSCHSCSATGQVERITPSRLGRRSVLLIRSTKNRGYSGGFNLALRALYQAAVPDYVVLLNSDALLRNDFVANLVQRGREYRSDIGLIGPRILDTENGSDWQRPERYRPSVWLLPLRALLIRRARNPRGVWSMLYQKFWYTEAIPGEVFMVHGACLVLTTAYLMGQPELDEHLFLYWEEATLSEEISRKGLRVWFDPHLVVRHGWGKSTTTAQKSEYLATSTKYYFEEIRQIGPIAKAYLYVYLWVLQCLRAMMERLNRGRGAGGS